MVTQLVVAAEKHQAVSTSNVVAFILYGDSSPTIELSPPRGPVPLKIQYNTPGIETGR